MFGIIGWLYTPFYELYMAVLGYVLGFNLTYLITTRLRSFKLGYLGFSNLLTRPETSYQQSSLVNLAQDPIAYKNQCCKT